MRIWSSAGSVTFAVPLVVICSISFFLLEFVQHDIELVEPLGPRALVALHPVMDGLERLAVEPVQPLPSVFPHLDRPHFSKHPQVLRHLGLSKPEQVHDLVHRPLPAGQQIEDLPPPGLGHRVERVRRGSCSCHGGEYICLYRNMSTRESGAGLCASAVRGVETDARAARKTVRTMNHPLATLLTALAVGGGTAAAVLDSVPVLTDALTGAG